MIYALQGIAPKIHETAWVAPTAVVIGDVTLEANVSIWFNAVLRGDSGRIVVGEGSNVQDGAVIHEETYLGKNCVVAHQTLVHRAMVGDNVLIANGSLVVGAGGNPIEIGEGAIVGAGAVVTPGTKVEPNTLVIGIPAKKVRDVDENLRRAQQGPAQSYQRSKERYRGNGLTLLDNGYDSATPPSA